MNFDRYLPPLIAGVILLLAYSAWTLPPGLRGMTGEELEKVKKGGVSVSKRPDSAGHEEMIQAAVLIDAPAEKIWAVMNDCERTLQFVPGLKACLVQEQNAEGEVIQHRVRYSWILPEVTYTFRAQYEKFSKISFRRIAGDLKEFKGTWRLEPLKEGRKTVVIYSVYIDPGFWIPQGVIRYLLRRELPDLMTGLRDEVLGQPQ